MDMSAVCACERQCVLFSRPVAGFPLGFTARLLEGGVLFIYGSEGLIKVFVRMGWREGDAELRIPAFQGQLAPLTPSSSEYREKY